MCSVFRSLQIKLRKDRLVREKTKPNHLKMGVHRKMRNEEAVSVWGLPVFWKEKREGRRENTCVRGGVSGPFGERPKLAVV